MTEGAVGPADVWVDLSEGPGPMERGSTLAGDAALLLRDVALQHLRRCGGGPACRTCMAAQRVIGGA